MASSRMYLTYDLDEETGKYLAVITMGQPQLGDDDVVVLDLELLPSPRACRKWFHRMRKERPWETRQ